jgi:tetratricopeptide (TPR) repeat protein
MRAFVFLVVVNVICPGTLFSQCLPRDSLQARINLIRNTPSDKMDRLKAMLECKELVKNCPKNTDSLYTTLLLYIGAQYYHRGDYIRAIEYTKRAIAIVRANMDDPATDKISLAKYYHHLSIYYDSLQLFPQKNEAVDSCIVAEMRLNTDYVYTALLLEGNVMDAFAKGDYNLCIDRATLGEQLIHKFYKVPSRRPSHIFYFIYYKASSFGALGRYADEEKFLQSKKTELEKLNDKEYKGDIYVLLGQLYKSKGDYKKAVANFQTALYYDKFSSRRDMTSQMLNELGLIYAENLKMYDAALQYYRKGLIYSQYKKLTVGSVSDSFYLLSAIANVHVKMKLFDSAFYFFQKAFDKMELGISEKDLVLHVQDYVNANDVEHVLSLVLNKADAYLERFYFLKDPASLHNALDVYKTADQLLSAIRIQLGDLESKLFWRRYSRRLYERAIEASYLLGHVNDAFYFFEKSRAVILTDELNEHTTLSGNDVLRLAEIKRKMLALRKDRDAHAVGSAEYTSIQHELLLHEIEVNKLGSAIKKSNPLYYQSLFDTSSITLGTMGKVLLTTGQTLLELFNGDSSVYALFITNDTPYFQKINKGIFDSLSMIVTKYVSSADLLNRNFDDYIQASNRLYRLIFQNINLPAGRIIISPDGRYFPFEALVTNKNPRQFFVENYAVSYTYSARYLLNNFNTNAAAASGPFMGMAPVTYGNALASLSGSDQSLQRMDKYFGRPANFLGSNATRRNFLKEYYKYKIIQLYTHATDSGSGGEPVIYFTDSTLSMSDLIYENRPATRLIVLSACETADGKLYNGEGVFSFNRQFATLGIPSCISTLWEADSRSTYAITELFYKYLAKGFPMDLALQSAKKKFIQSAGRENELPYYWAAPILVGQSGTIELPRRFPWQWVIALGILVLIGIGGWKARKRRIEKHRNLVNATV